MSSSASLIEHASKFGTQKLYPEDKKDYYELEGVPKLSISPKPVVGDDPNQPKSVQQSRASSSARPKTSDSRAPSPRLSALPEPPSPSTRAYEITTAGSTIAGATLQQGFWQQHRLAIATSLPILYGVLELLMLAYFLDLYLTLPRTNTGGLQRISPVYSLWPYVACIGGKNVSAFAAFATIISLFFVGTFAADVALAWHTQPNYWLRRTRLVLSIVWGILFVCQAGASTNTVSHLHLYVISVKSVFSIAIKSVTWAMDYQSRKQVPLMRSDPVAMKSKRWKDIIIIFAFREPSPTLFLRLQSV